MEPNDPLSGLQNRRTRSNVVGCIGCAGVFVLPSLLVSSGAWSLLSGIFPLIGVILPIVAIAGWVNAGNIGKEIRAKQRAMGDSYPSTAGPKSGAPTGTANSSAASGKPPARSMASRLDKARRAGH